MKKSFILFAALATMGLFSSCDPVEEGGSLSYSIANADKILDLVQITQTDADGKPAADGNYFSYTTSPATDVCFYNFKADGSENLLAHGPSGSFSILPTRGNPTEQQVFIRIVNADNTVAETSTKFNVFVESELKPEIALLCGNGDAPATKEWYWDFTQLGACWGNFGADGSWRGASLGDFKWWGVDDASQLADQLEHSTTGIVAGWENNNAHMVFKEDGTIVTYDGEGNVIVKGSFSVENYDPNSGAFSIGVLHTQTDANQPFKSPIMFPFEINANKNRGTQAEVTDYQIFNLDHERMTLYYPDNGAFSGWSEGTYWAFAAKQIAPDIENTSVSYTWDFNQLGTCWGNFGADGSWRDASLAPFKWWGVDDASQLADQLNHSVEGVVMGDESNDAYMTLSADGKIISYDKDGKVIRSSEYEIDWSTADGWKLGSFRTKAPGVLFPYEINAASNRGSAAYVTDFQIYSYGPNSLVLTYPDNGAFSGWSEGTYWSFKKKY
ncbi:MAG: hypothetical protein KBT33_10010 [Prevotellaceae bacterium]|nr:hypothetical protein [Candidatus Minthosoma equi]